MKTHADKKSILEVEFLDEEGTGLCCNEDSSKIYVEGSVSDLLAHPKQRTYTTVSYTHLTLPTICSV